MQVTLRDQPKRGVHPAGEGLLLQFHIQGLRCSCINIKALIPHLPPMKELSFNINIERCTYTQVFHLVLSQSKI